MQRTKRALSAEIVRCDGFITMPAAAQALYMHLVMTCDDEGFTSSIDLCKFLAHASDDDEQILLKRRFILEIQSDDVKVTVIKHWRKCNYAKAGIIESDFSERSKVFVKPNGNYTLDPNEGKPLSTGAHAQRTCPADVSDAPAYGRTQPARPLTKPNLTKTKTKLNLTKPNLSDGISQEDEPSVSTREDDDVDPFA